MTDYYVNKINAAGAGSMPAVGRASSDVSAAELDQAYHLFYGD